MLFPVPQRVPWSSWMDSLHLVSANNTRNDQKLIKLLSFSKFLSSKLLMCCVTGFRMLEAFNLTEKTYSYVKGVSMEPGSFNSYTAYRLHKNAFLTQPTTWVSRDITLFCLQIWGWLKDVKKLLTLEKCCQNQRYFLAVACFHSFITSECVYILFVS